ncbi:TIGR00153 family protein [Methanothermococcus sp.]|uniref:TIGR00153 family protein n=1 Tax=Methanothermococcus sp. TaxID=2614238 RepID=UPI0025EC2D0B|nr:TIGR00153 family protein [Methanothermococcus sp.]
MTIFLFKRKPEKEVINLLKTHVSLSIDSIKVLDEYIDDKSDNKLREIIKLEKEGDEIRKRVILNLYEAFLPSMKKELNYSIEILDEVLDSIKHGALIYNLMTFDLDDTIEKKCKLILNISLNMLNSMYNLIDVFENGGDFKKHIKDIKAGEEKIDDIHHEIYRYMVNMKINSFWEGKLMSDFVDKITEISDYIENVSDEFQIIYLSYR